MTQEELTAFWGPPVHVYTREDAIADGVLVDLTEWARENGFACPTAVTAGVWAMLNDIPAGSGQDLRGRAHDLLFMARLQIARAVARGRVRFLLLIATSHGRTNQPFCLAIDGEGDSQIATILLPHED